MSKPNRFSGLLDASRAKETGEVEETAAPLQPTPEPKELKNKEKAGKNSNPAYVQISAYIRKDTRLKAKQLLLGSEEDLSDVIEKLLSEWIESRT